MTHSMRIVSNEASPTFNRHSDVAQLGSLVRQLTQSLADLNSGIQSASDQQGDQVGDLPGGIDLRFDVRSARKLRHLRKTIFGHDLDTGPAWDILLHLFDSYVLQRRDTIGNVTDGAELPGATALRWIDRLGRDGYLVLRDDHLDRRRRFVELTDAGIEAMTKYFTGAAPNRIAA